MKINTLTLMTFTLSLMSASSSYSDGLSHYKKSRIKQLSKYSENYNYYEEKNNRVKKGSKSLGINSNNLRGYRNINNWVEIDNSNVGNFTRSFSKRITPKRISGSTAKNQNFDRNLGVTGGCNRSANVDNTVIIKSSTVENAVIGGTVNSGISLSGCKKSVNKSYKNRVTIQKSRVGGAAGILSQ